jgi:hypothetical protein
MCASNSGRVAARVSASDTALTQEVADGKINVQSACALDTWYTKYSVTSYKTVSLKLGNVRTAQQFCHSCSVTASDVFF